MSTTVKTGWLEDSNGDKFAPKTLTSQVQMSDGTLIEDKIQSDINNIKKEIPTKTSELTNDSGFIISYTETDPTVPSWAKASTKPTYTKSEVGLSNVDNIKQYSASNPPPYPVTKVNGKTGDITLAASDVGALPNTTKIPTKVSDLTNDSGFITSAPDEIYVGNGEMPETATIQILMDGSDEEQAMMDELKEYIDGELQTAKDSGEFDGKSAYQYAQEGGYTGTEKEFAHDINPDNIKALATPKKGVDYFDGKNGSNYIITDDDKNEIADLVIAALGGQPIFGYIDGNNNIIITAALDEEESYSVKYEMEDGTKIDIGSLVFEEEEEEVTKTNFFVVDGDGYLNPGRASSAGADRTDVTTCLLSNYIEVQNGDEVYAYGARSSDANTAMMGLYKTNKTGVGFYVRSNPEQLTNVSMSDEVDVFTINYEGAAYMRCCFLIPSDINTLKVNIKRNGEWL